MTTTYIPAPELIDVEPEALVTDPCGCNQPDAVHQDGDAAWCRVTLEFGAQ